jgi:hypothetical protein
MVIQEGVYLEVMVKMIVRKKGHYVYVIATIVQQTITQLERFFISVLPFRFFSW